MIEYQYSEPVAVIGDIHGCADLLAELLLKLGDRHILCLGDVGDRGPDTKRVLDLLIEWKAKGVLGNHDQWLRQLAVRETFDRIALTSCVGGRATLKSYGFTDASNTARVEAEAILIPKAHRDWLMELPLLAGLTVMGSKYWMSHAGLPRFEALQRLPNEQVIPALEAMDPENLLWSFEDPRMMLTADRPVIMGHRAVPEPMDLGNIICVDTGAGKGGRLTALLLPERTFVTVG